ncbi:MAG: hypothetical protein NDJ75_06290 [Thermoanaerobaculia bacterium]|nr:hypothetical protein [Thermoanaerobaculia bacterium]
MRRRAVARRTVCASLLASTLLACGAREPAGEERRPRELDLLSRWPEARLTRPPGQSDAVARWHETIAGETREVLFMHPPARVEFPRTRMTLDARLEISFGLVERVWTEAGDGVDFVVSARDDKGVERRLFSAYLDPKHEPADRRWVDAVVLLGTYAGREASLILETGPGPDGDLTYDWAAWSRAQLRLDPP